MDADHKTEPAHGANLRIGRSSEPCRPYHVTKCLPRPCSYTLGRPEVARIIVDSIRWRQVNGLAHLLAFVVMPDHVHWLFVLSERAFVEARRPEHALAELVGGFAKHTGLEINRLLGRRGQFWQDGFHDHAIRTDVEEALAVLEYIHSNPVRKGLCAAAEDWPWSTAHLDYAPWIERDWFW